MENIIQEANGNSKWNISVGHYLAVVALLYGQLFHIAEFVAYIFIFHQLYSHNEIMTNDILGLSEKAMNKRHKKNVISFGGQFATFLIEMCLLIRGFVSFATPRSLKEHLGLWPIELLFFSNFFERIINTITFILASPELRWHFIEKVFNFLK